MDVLLLGGTFAEWPRFLVFVPLNETHSPTGIVTDQDAQPQKDDLADDEPIHHTYSAYARGLDAINAAHH